MKFYTVKTPFLIKRLFPKLVWDLPHDTTGKEVYLTFDDGPIPEVTEWVLDTLKEYKASATFFCIGDNVRKHPHIFRRILDEGHAIGNHTQNHLNARKVDFDTYMENVTLGEQSIQQALDTGVLCKLFRPPYGQLTSTISRALRKQGYHIIMWDVLSADFDKRVSPEQCLKNTLKSIRPGSIVIFHDSIKASTNMMYALPEVLKQCRAKGMSFMPIRL